MIEIDPYHAVENFTFGVSMSVVENTLGTPIRRGRNRDGEDELIYPDMIYRFDKDRLVEVTITLTSPISVEGQQISSFREWLPVVDPDFVSTVGFLISYRYGIAVDMYDHVSEYVSVFEQGRWDAFRSNDENRKPNKSA